MHELFYNATSFNQNISKWNVSQVPSRPRDFDTLSGFEGNETLQPTWNIPEIRSSGGSRNFEIHRISINNQTPQKEVSVRRGDEIHLTYNTQTYIIRVQEIRLEVIELRYNSNTVVLNYKNSTQIIPQISSDIEFELLEQTPTSLSPTLGISLQIPSPTILEDEDFLSSTSSSSLEHNVSEDSSISPQEEITSSQEEDISSIESEISEPQTVNFTTRSGNRGRFTTSLDSTQRQDSNTLQLFSTIQADDTSVIQVLIPQNLEFNNTQLEQVQVIESQRDNGLNYIIVQNLQLPQGVTKDIRLPISSSHNSICVVDEKVNSIEELSLDCSQEREVELNCNGEIQSGYKCSISQDGTFYEISGLEHSAVYEFIPSSSQEEENSLPMIIWFIILIALGGVLYIMMKRRGLI